MAKRSSKKKGAKRKKRQDKKGNTGRSKKGFYGGIFAIALLLGIGGYVMFFRDNATGPKLDPLTDGKRVYEFACSGCHGPNGEGKVGPGLNGTAHSWHHPDPNLRKTIKKGGKKMPPLGDKLSNEEIEAVMAYFKGWWKPWQVKRQGRQ